MSIFNKYKFGSNYKKLLLACYMFNLLIFAIKLVYTAQLPAIIDFFQTTRAQASLGLTIYYFVYAAAQIALSFFITKINFKTYLLITSTLSTILFSLISITDSLTFIWIIFAINGFLQAGCWGGTVFIISKYLPNETLSYSNKLLSTSSTVGNAITYLISAFFVAVANWKITFVFFGIVLLLSILYLFIQVKIIDKLKRQENEEIDIEESDNSTEKHSTYVVPLGVKFNTSLFMIFIVIVAFLCNSLIYGLGNWIPNLLKEIHGFPTSLSILLTMIMPLIAVCATLVMYNNFDKKGKIFSKTAFLSFVLLLMTIMMIFGFDLNFIFAIIMCALLKFLPQAAYSGYSTYTLLKIKNYINPGTSTLIVNSVASFAAGLMPFITGLIMDNFGWMEYYAFMSLITLILLILIVVGNIVIKKKNNITAWF